MRGRAKMASALFDWLLVPLLANGMVQEKKRMFRVVMSMWWFWRFKLRVLGHMP